MRITVRAEGEKVVREGHGCGEARGVSAGEAHDLALKISETDATKRALATFGQPFGLALYASQKLPRDVVETPYGNRKCVPAQKIDPKQTQSPKRNGIDKSALRFGVARRLRDKDHLKFVAGQPCLICSQQPSDPHHLRFIQPRGIGLKVSDEFTVPLCRAHHRDLHHSGNEVAWWHENGIRPVEIAERLWHESRDKRLPDVPTGSDTGDATPKANSG